MCKEVFLLLLLLLYEHVRELLIGFFFCKKKINQEKILASLLLVLLKMDDSSMGERGVRPMHYWNQLFMFFSLSLIERMRERERYEEQLNVFSIMQKGNSLTIITVTIPFSSFFSKAKQTFLLILHFGDCLVCKGEKGILFQ